MPAGGRRVGAGRKSGAAWAGQPAPDRDIRQLARSRVRDVLKSSSDPLAVLVEIANDSNIDVQVRVQAALGAAPFMFPRLSAAVIATTPMSSKQDMAALVERISQRFARLTQPATIEASAAPANADDEVPAE